MRVLLVGSSSDRARVRSLLAETSIEIVGEFSTQAAALASGASADATVLAGRTRGDIDEPPAEALTPRETDVLALVAEGFSNKAIAERLGISDQTVKFHVASITGKLGASNRTEAVRRAVRQGLIVL
jgi:DNA-binding CsgD family transcriptional regulator